MFGTLNNYFGRKPPQKGGPMMPEGLSGPISGRDPNERKQAYSKVFRWRLPDGQTAEPAAVELVGTFSHWKPIPMTRDSALDSWHVTIHHIPGNKTHHYMMLVDGKPVYDKMCDGLAVPHGPQEEQYALATDKGPRVFMLFAQTK